MFDVEDNAYETLVLAYSRELMFLYRLIIVLGVMLKRRAPHHSEDVVMHSEKEMTNMEKSTPVVHHSLQWVPTK
jgi:hypothetical protein